MSPERPPSEPPRAAAPPLWRRLLPFVLAAALVGWVLSRIDWDTFVKHLAGVSYLGLIGCLTLFVLLLLSADTLASGYVYRRTIKDMSFRQLFVVRGASYLPSLLNHHVGQAWVTYFLSRTHAAPLRSVVGATLVVYMSWGGCLLALSCVVLLARGLAAEWLALPLGAGLAYLVLLAVKPRRLAQSRLLGPLFEAGVTGHLIAMLLRIPHLVVLFLGTWLPFFFFDVNIPLPAALSSVPIIMVAVTLPVTPQGLGTRDALAAELFPPYVAPAAAATEQKLAVIAAATTTTLVVIALVEVLLGLLLLRPATRLVRAPE